MEERVRSEREQAILKKFAKIFKNGIKDKAKRDIIEANQKAVKAKKNQIRFIDTIAALITSTIILIYFYEFETFIAVTYNKNGTISKKRHESTSINSILRALMLVMSIVVCKLPSF